MQQPKCPTPEEIARHELTHLPAATWCEACVKGRGREAPHRDQRGGMLDSVLPVIQCDFGFLTDAGEEPVIALFASCGSSTNLFATLCTQKGPKDTYVVAAFASRIIQSDGEPAIPALVAAVRDKVTADRKAEQITCEASPKGSHESNGAAERTVQQVRGMARVYLEHVREKTGSEFPPKSPWWACALRHAAWVYNRFHVRADTRVAPYAKIRLKTYAQPVLLFGELVLARRPGSHLQKSQTQFVYGCWLGRDSHTDEHIVGSKSWGFPHANGQETDRGQELVDRGCGRYGVDAVEDRGDDARQTTRGCRWREKRTHLERAAENHHREPRHWMPKARQTNQKCRVYHSRTQTMKLQNALRWRRRAHQCRIRGRVLLIVYGCT